MFGTRILGWLGLWGSLSLLAACGGGSSGGGAVLQAAALNGLVYSVDGQTQDRSGVTIRLAETSAVAQTAPDGRFRFDNVPAGSFTLELLGVAGARLAANGAGDSMDGPDDNGMDNGTDSGTDSGMDSGTDGGTDSGTDGGMESEVKNEIEEDDSGNPVVDGVSGGDQVEARMAVRNGRIEELSVSGAGRRRAEQDLTRDPLSSLADVEGEVRIETRSDREKFKVEVDHLAPGTVVEVFLKGTDPAATFASVGTAAADSTGEAQFERNTKDGDTLPAGAAMVSDLVGFAIEVRLASTGEVLLTGEVPGLPDGMPTIGDSPVAGGRGRGEAHLTADEPGLEGSVEIRRRPEDGRQRFKLEAENLTPGEIVAFQIEDSGSPGSFVTLTTLAADSSGDAELETEDGMALPLGVPDVEDLVGLEVRVVRDATGDLLLHGTVPALVAD